MAADQTAIKVGTLTLTINTSQTIELTGPGRTVELQHAGNVPDPVYFKVATTEALADTLAGGGADEEEMLGSGDAKVITLPRAAGQSLWIGLRSVAAATVSAKLIRSSV